MFNKWDSFMLGFVMGILVTIIVFMFYPPAAEAHESDKWKHLTEGTGYCIMARDCGMGISVWGKDSNEDGIIDGCLWLRLIHNKFHGYVTEPVIVDGKPTCTCEEN